MVKDLSDSVRENLVPPPYVLLFLISSKESFIPSHKYDNTYHGLCYTSHGELAGMRNPMRDQSDNPSHH